MARYRAGYDLDYGRRDFDNRRARLDVGSHGYDRGFRAGGQGGEAFDRPWVGGYREGFQGGSGGIGVGTGGASMQSNRRQERYGRDYDRGYHGYDREYRQDLERNRPAYSPVGGMAPTMGGSYVSRGSRAWPYDGWFNHWSRWF